MNATAQSDTSGTRSEESSAQKREDRIVAVLIAVHVLIALPLAYSLNIWIDESYTLVTTDRGLLEMLAHSRDFQLQPPVYFTSIWLWRQLGDSIPFLRLHSVLVSVATLWFVHLAARRWSPRLPTPWVILPLTVNPWMLFAATELRPYCMVLLWSALLLYLFYGAFVSESPRWIEKIFYTIVAVLALYTYYYIGFLLPGGALVLLIWRKWRLLLEYVSLMALAGLLFVPQLLLSLRDSSIYSDGATNLPSMMRAAEFVGARVFATITGLFAYPEPLRMAIALLVVGPIALAYFLGRKPFNIRNTAIPIIAATVALFYFVLVASAIGENIFNRHFLVALVPFHLAVLAISERLQVYRAAILKCFMGSLAVICLLSSCIEFSPLAKLGDHRRVSEYLMGNEQPGECVYVAVSHAEYPLRHYYRGVNEIVPIPFHDDLFEYDPRRWRIHNRQEILDAFADVTSGQRVWVYIDRSAGDEFLGLPMNLHFLEEVLAEQYTVEIERDYYHAKLRRVFKN